MPAPVYRVMQVLCTLVSPLPIGTNLGLAHLLWMLLSGELLVSRGAIIPGLSTSGLPVAAVRRAWAALGQGTWTSDDLLARLVVIVESEGPWQPHTHAGYHPVAVDTTGFWRPRLVDCPTKHYSSVAGKALPAIPLGLVARVGSVNGQRMALPLAIVRADRSDPGPQIHQRRLVQRAKAVSAPDDVLVFDRGFGVALLQGEEVPTWVVRLPKNFTARRATPPAYQGRGRPPTRGARVRPLSRQRKGRVIAATPPDQVMTWTEGTTTLRAEQWPALVLPDADPDSAVFTVVAIHDPRYAEPLLLATPLALTPPVVRDVYHDRWPVEQLPLAAKQMLGAARQFVHVPETCQRWPELTLLAGALLTYVAATQPAVPTGFWDRRPRPTPGRLRRVLSRCVFPNDFPLPARVREKASVTTHLPKGNWGQRRPKTALVSTTTVSNHAHPLPEVA